MPTRSDTQPKLIAPDPSQIYGRTMNILETPSESNLLETPSTEMDSIQSQDLKRRLLWHGIFICTLGFISGMFLPLYANPRAGLATHAIAITQGMFLAIIAFSYPQLKLSLWIARLTYWLLLISAYIGLLGQLLAAMFGLSRMFLITAHGLPEGIPWMETSVEISTKAVSNFLLIACFIVLYGLRKTKSDSTSPEKS